MVDSSAHAERGITWSGGKRAAEEAMACNQEHSAGASHLQLTSLSSGKASFWRRAREAASGSLDTRNPFIPRLELGTHCLAECIPRGQVIPFCAGSMIKLLHRVAGLTPDLDPIDCGARRVDRFQPAHVVERLPVLDDCVHFIVPVHCSREVVVVLDAD